MQGAFVLIYKKLCPIRLAVLHDLRYLYHDIIHCDGIRRESVIPLTHVTTVMRKNLLLQFCDAIDLSARVIEKSALAVFHTGKKTAKTHILHLKAIRFIDRFPLIAERRVEGIQFFKAARIFSFRQSTNRFLVALFIECASTDTEFEFFRQNIAKRRLRFKKITKLRIFFRIFVENLRIFSENSRIHGLFRIFIHDTKEGIVVKAVLE